MGPWLSHTAAHSCRAWLPLLLSLVLPNMKERSVSAQGRDTDETQNHTHDLMKGLVLPDTLVSKLFKPPSLICTSCQFCGYKTTQCWFLSASSAHVPHFCCYSWMGRYGKLGESTEGGSVSLSVPSNEYFTLNAFLRLIHSVSRELICPKPAVPRTSRLLVLNPVRAWTMCSQSRQKSSLTG